MKKIRKIILSLGLLALAWLWASVKNDTYCSLVKLFQKLPASWIPILILSGYLISILLVAYFFDLYKENKKLKSNLRFSLTFIPKLGIYYNNKTNLFFCPKKDCNVPLQHEEVATKDFFRIRFRCPNHGYVSEPLESGEYITLKRAYELAKEEVSK